MRNRMIAITAGALLALPAVAGAADDTAPAKSPAQTCKAERAAIGVTAFRDLYGTNKTKANAFGKCVSKAQKSDAAAKENAAKTCKDEQAADPAAFATKYGTGKKGKNAYGKCVSQTAKAKREAQEQDRVNAAKQCKAEKEADAKAFAEKYGSKRNAFGKCVSQAAKA